MVPTPSPASKEQLPTVAQTLQSEVVSLAVPDETREKVTTHVAPTQPSAQEPPLVLMLPDGAIAEETEMVTHAVRSDVVLNAPVVNPRLPTTAGTEPVVARESTTTV